MIDRRRVLVSGAASTSLPAGAALPTPAGGRIGFEVVRKGSKLGTHVLRFGQDRDRLTVTVAVSLVYKLAGITLYRYTHNAVEVWSGGQVVALDSQTDDNGDRYQVSARREAAGLVVQGSAVARYVAPADALPATHWNRRELEVPWINTQDGRLVRLAVAKQGIASIPTATGKIRAERFSLTGEVRMDLFYDDQSWVGLTFLKGDVPIQYLRMA